MASSPNRNSPGNEKNGGSNSEEAKSSEITAGTSVPNETENIDNEEIAKNKGNEKNAENSQNEENLTNTRERESEEDSANLRNRESTATQEYTINAGYKNRKVLEYLEELEKQEKNSKEDFLQLGNFIRKISRSLNSFRLKTAFKNPLVYLSRNRPRQPFMNQCPQRPQQPLPAPPSYYTNEVTHNQEMHQPSILSQNSLSPEQRSNFQSPIVRQPTSSNNAPGANLAAPSRRPDGQTVTFETPQYYNQQAPVPEGHVITNLPNFKPGDMAIMPNALMNVAFWAPYPSRIPANVPACLAHLVAADSLFIVQQTDIIELFIDADEPNFYLIQNKNGQCIYYAYETSDLCGQFCCRQARGLQLHVMDMYHNEIIYMNKPCGCNDYFCCYPVMEVYSPPLVPVGAVIKTFHATHDEFSIVDADERKMFKIHGPCCLRTCGCCIEAEFTIHALDPQQTEIGVIRREWGGFVRTFFTNADFFGITFPEDLDVRVKAIFLGALFLIDYTMFEA